MITFNEQTSLIEPGMVLLSWTIVGDKYKYGPEPVEFDKVKEAKNNIVRRAIISRISSLLLQRENNYRFSGGHHRESTLKAVQHLKYNIETLKTISTMLEFFTYTIDEIIPHLEAIQPSDKSRFVNFHSSLITLDGFSRRCLDYYVKLRETSKSKAVTAA